MLFSPLPNASMQFDTPDMVVNATGLLPNDRRHVLKLNGSYRVRRRITLGSSFVWKSGTPLSEMGVTSLGMPWYAFLSQRGTAGRTPAVWDLNLRAICELGRAAGGSRGTRLIVDAFHVGSPRKAVNYDQFRYFGLDAEGNPTDPNPNYMRPTQFQPPMAVRLGVKASF